MQADRECSDFGIAYGRHSYERLMRCSPIMATNHYGLSFVWTTEGAVAVRNCAAQL
jgi:hypothetical protein